MFLEHERRPIYRPISCQPYAPILNVHLNMTLSKVFVIQPYEPSIVLAVTYILFFFSLYPDHILDLGFSQELKICDQILIEITSLLLNTSSYNAGKYTFLRLLRLTILLDSDIKKTRLNTSCLILGARSHLMLSMDSI